MNEEQYAAFHAFTERKNIFLTGSAGTGKSFTLKEIIKWARDQNLKMGITATTGSAAFLIGGRTLHSFLGIGLGKKSPRDMAMILKRKNPQLYAKLSTLDVLIIEEVSMLDKETFEKISEYLSIIRGNSAPFGGLQLFLLGDFCQLPPLDRTYCFQSTLWGMLDPVIIDLKRLMRQSGDEEFQKILHKLRYGRCSSGTLAKLKERLTSLQPHATKLPNGIKPTILFATNDNVDKINAIKFKQLVDKGALCRTYTCAYSDERAKTWGTSCKVPESIQLCKGAQVVCSWNVDQDNGVINGTRGVIAALDAVSVTITVMDGRQVTIPMITVKDEDCARNTITFMPLKLAWALSIHKSQGMTLDALVLDLGNSIFEYGQAYVALSRARNLASVRILAVEKESFKTHPDVLAFYRNITAQT